MKGAMAMARKIKRLQGMVGKKLARAGELGGAEIEHFAAARGASQV